MDFYPLGPLWLIFAGLMHAGLMQVYARGEIDRGTYPQMRDDLTKGASG
jgi:hypothetical protein